MKTFLSGLGWLIAKCPECIVNSLCWTVGAIIYYFPFGRISLAYANIARSLPEIPLKERRKIAFESARRMVEMALFVLASPHMSTENLRERVEVSENLLKELEELSKNPKPTVLMIPHFAMMETITMFPTLVDMKLPRTGVFYRPFDIQGMEEWVKSSRQRFGIDLLSRKKGLFQAVSYLRDNGCVAVLFDQKVHSGMRSFLLDRICMTSELPGILVENSNATAATFWATRTGFWRSRIDCKKFEGKSIEEITYEGNNWLSEKLRTDPIARYDWLWLHRRWQHIDGIGHLLSLKDKKNIIDFSLKKMGLTELPRKFRIHITAPDSLRDTIALLPLIRLMRISRADAYVSLLVQRKHYSALQNIAIVDNLIAVPNREDGAFARISAYRKLREDYPEIHFNFTDSFLDDFCSKMLGADFSLAIQTTRKRFFMRDVFKPQCMPKTDDVAIVYEHFLRKYGLRGEVDSSSIEIQNPEELSISNNNQ